MKSFPLILVSTLVFISCNGLKMDQLLNKESPYSKYLKALESSDLKEFAVVQEWKKQGHFIHGDSLMIVLPYSELSYFDPKHPVAKFWRYPVLEGQEVSIEIKTFTDSISSFFLDVFDGKKISDDEEKLHSLWHAASDGTIQYAVENEGIHVLRIQPELFRGGMIELSINFEGSLSFPLPEKTTKNIASFWGDPREGNRRKHEGIDVFAPRGTPVLAASDGRIRRVGNNRLGGKIIWLNSGQGHSQYYAHLDSQLVSFGQKVLQGDTIGLVGNTGNAITTFPHLHFGIYRSGQGATDPLPFVIEKPDLLSLDVKDTTGIKNNGIITAARANIRNLPYTQSRIIGTFPINTFLYIEGKTKNWYRIKLPDGKMGFIFDNLIAISKEPLGTLKINPDHQIKPSWGADIVLGGKSLSGEAQIYGYFKGHALIQTQSGFRGWRLPD
ncbi:MAG: peptidoglycan DD-metalloendopeptidase family protein [Cyclobacteriaceae bacterium]